MTDIPGSETLRPQDIPPEVYVVAAALVRDAAQTLEGDKSEQTDFESATPAALLGRVSLQLTTDPTQSMSEAASKLFKDVDLQTKIIADLEKLERGIDPEAVAKLARIDQLREFCSDGDLAVSSLKKGETITLEYITKHKSRAFLTVRRINDDRPKATAMDDLLVVARTAEKHLEDGLYDLEPGAIIYLGFPNDGVVTGRLLRGSHPAWDTDMYESDGQAYVGKRRIDDRFTLEQIYYGENTSIALFPAHD